MPDRHFGRHFPDKHFPDKHFADSVDGGESVDCYLQTASIGVHLPTVLWDVKIQFSQPAQTTDYVSTDYGSLVTYQGGAPAAFDVAYRFSNGREFLVPSI